MATDAPPRRPDVCAHCGAAAEDQLKPHCTSPACPWTQCRVCGQTTGRVYGVLRAVSLRVWHG